MDKPVGEMTREELRQFVMEIVHDEVILHEVVDINGVRIGIRPAPRLSAEVFAAAACLRFRPADGIEGILSDLREDRTYVC